MKLETLNLSHLEQTAYFSLLRNEFKVVTPRILSQTLEIPRPRATALLIALASKGALHRVGKGIYVVIPPDVLYKRRSFIQDPYLVIHPLMMILETQYYVAYQSAAYLHGAAEQLPFTLTVAVTRQRRVIRLGSASIRFVTLKTEKFFGFEEIKYQDSPLAVSDVEKTILDCLDRFDLCGGVDEVIRTIGGLTPHVNPHRLLGYLQRLQKPVVAQRLGLILERGDNPPRDLLTALTNLVSPYVYPLDPRSPHEGARSRRWNIIENVSVEV